MWIYAQSLCLYTVPALKLGKEHGENANDIFLLKQNLDIMFLWQVIKTSQQLSNPVSYCQK